ncbi:rhophilin-2 [Sergentomyia squamirostris]
MGFSLEITCQGSDPRVATCRGKLQNRRCKLNQEINKELRLRAGAENLYKATSNRKLKDTVALELSFVNSNLQLLKEQLSELNSSVEIYQNESSDAVIPMVPLGLKETKEVNFMEPFSDFILEHYSEDSSYYEDAISDITDTRQGARTPTRDPAGVALLFRYYNLLYYVERRFFPPDRSLGVYFEWYDSLTGVPSCQRTVAFEKACILFNLGAIYTQIGARQDRSSEKGLDLAVDAFLRAAGVFKHIYDTFTNAPSMDLKPQVLEVLVALMLAQARECLFEKLLLQVENMTMKTTDKDHLHRDLSGEAAQLTMEYTDMHMSIQASETHTYLPECWAGLVPLKAEHYKALSHYHSAKSISTKKPSPTKKSSKSSASSASSKTSSSTTPSDSFIYDESAANENINPVALKRAHLKEALSSHDEAQRLQRMCRELKNKKALANILHHAHTETLDEFEKFQDEKTEKFIDEDFDLLEAPLNPCSKFTLSLTGPDFTAYKVEDPFRKLGPIAIFSARRHWTAPRNVRLQKGTSLEGGKPSRKLSSRSSGCCQCKKSSSFDSGRCEVCAKYITYTADESSNKEETASNDDSIESFGFHVRGDAPVIISYVEMNSLADLGGIKDGDFIVEISGIDVKSYTHQQVVKLIQAAGSSIELKLITPMDRNYLKPVAGSTKGSVSTLSGGSSSGVSSGAPSPTGTTSKPKTRSKSTKSRLGTGGWNPFRRTQSMGKIF